MKTLVILAGGKSLRMGRDKAFLETEGETFIERLFKNASKTFERIIISVDTKAHGEKMLSLPAFKDASAAPEVVADLYPESGPMGAIVSVFESTDVSRFSVISVDVPGADMDVLSFLYDSCEKQACLLKFEGKKRESLVAAYDRSSEEAFKVCLRQGLYKIRKALDIEHINVISAKEIAALLPGKSEDGIERSFMNYNTPAELEKMGER